MKANGNECTRVFFCRYYSCSLLPKVLPEDEILKQEEIVIIKHKLMHPTRVHKTRHRWSSLVIANSREKGKETRIHHSSQIDWTRERILRSLEDCI